MKKTTTKLVDFPTIKETLNSGYSERVKAHRKAYMKAYYSRPEVKAHVKAYKKAYYLRPEVKAHRKAYYLRPEVKAHRKAYKKAYYRKNKVLRQSIIAGRREASDSEVER